MIFEIKLYIFWFLHQTTTDASTSKILQRLYIFWFLHQTTTSTWLLAHGCTLYIFWFLHQTTTETIDMKDAKGLYIFWFLHQTTTVFAMSSFCPSCISFDSYIKPQLVGMFNTKHRVVYLLIPTSNHNLMTSIIDLENVVYLLIPTSNHNLLWFFDFWSKVVYLLIPTSNHNSRCVCHLLAMLYIFWFLHQTTTESRRIHTLSCCISFDSYIKPQRSLLGRCNK